MSSESVEYKFKGDTDDLVKNVDKADKSTKKLDLSIGNIVKTMAGLKILKGSFNFLKDGIMYASDINENVGIMSQVFGEANDSMLQWARDSQKAFGLPEREATRFLGTMGAMLDATGFTAEETQNMSKVMVGLTGDVASFYNLPHDVAYNKMKAVVTGETESLKDLGIVMTQTNLNEFARAQGINKTIDKMTEKEKVELRYLFIQEQLKHANGDFTRTNADMANQMQILSNATKVLGGILGGFLKPALEVVLNVLNFFLAKIIDTTRALQESAGFVAFTERMHDLKWAINEGDLSVLSFGTSNEKLNVILGILKDGVMTLISGAIKPLNDIWIQLKTSVSNLMIPIKELITEIFNLDGSTKQAGESTSLFDSIINALVVAFEYASLVIQFFIQIIELVITVILKVITIAIEPCRVVIDALRNAFDIIKPSIQLVIDAFGNLTGKTQESGSQLSIMDAIIKVLTTTFNVIATVLSKLIGLFAQVLSWVLQLIAGFLNWASQSTFLQGTLKALTGVIDVVISAGGKLMSGFVDVLTAGFQKLTGVIDGVKGALTKVGEVASSVGSKVSNTFSKINPFSRNIGMDFDAVLRGFDNGTTSNTTVQNMYDITLQSKDSINSNSIYRLVRQVSYGFNSLNISQGRLI